MARPRSTHRKRTVAFKNAHTVIRMTATECSVSTQADHKRSGITESTVVDLPPAPELSKYTTRAYRDWKRGRAAVAEILAGIHGIVASTPRAPA